MLRNVVKERARPKSLLWISLIPLVAPAEHILDRLWHGLGTATAARNYGQDRPGSRHRLRWEDHRRRERGRAYVRLDHHSPWPIALHVGSKDAAPGNNQMNNTFKMLSTSSLP